MDFDSCPFKEVFLYLVCCCYHYLLGLYFVFVLLFYNHFAEIEKAGCFNFIVILLSCDCLCCMALPHGVVGRFAVCDCGMSLSYSLTCC